MEKGKLIASQNERLQMLIGLLKKHAVGTWHVAADVSIFVACY